MSKIKIIKNKQLSVSHIKMNCDGFLSPPPAEPLNSLGKSFFIGIFGAPGSGKTNMMLSLLKDRKGFYKRFGEIYFFSPSVHTISDGLPIPDENIFDEYDPELIFEIINDLNDPENDSYGTDVLFIFDDIVADLKKNDKTFMKMAFNRRHAIKSGGSLNIMLVSQKYNKIPLAIRTGFSGLILFRPNTKREWNIIYDEVIDVDKDIAQAISKITYKKKHSFLFVNLMESEIENKYFPNFHTIAFV